MINKPTSDPAPAPKKSRRLSFTSAIIGLAVIILLGFGSGIAGTIVTVTILKPNLFDDLSQITEKTIDKIKIIDEESSVTQAVENSSPAVVNIIAKSDIDYAYDPLLNFNSENTETEQRTISYGSGFIVSSDGYIVTNKHVVSSANADYTVVTNDDKEYHAVILARDPANDIAILKVEAENLPYLKFGDSSSLKAGQKVIAIGNSLGAYSNTVSTGVISGLKRSITTSDASGYFSEDLENIIQTDAAINQGNSGGPLLDITGQVIGMNTAIVYQAQNIGFAIPSNDLKKVVESVQTTGKIETAYLGVRYLLVNPEVAKRNSLSKNYGALVVSGKSVDATAVVEDSPADKAGIQENDVILEIDGKKIERKNQLQSTIRSKSPEEKVKLKILRDNEELEMEVTLEKRPETE